MAWGMGQAWVRHGTNGIGGTVWCGCAGTSVMTHDQWRTRVGTTGMVDGQWIACATAAMR